MDDRIGCAVVIEALKRLKQTQHDIYAVFAAQEEVGLRGARVAAYGIDPDVGIAFDVTRTGDTPKAHTMEVSLGKGGSYKGQGYEPHLPSRTQELSCQTGRRQ